MPREWIGYLEFVKTGQTIFALSPFTLGREYWWRDLVTRERCAYALGNTDTLINSKSSTRKFNINSKDTAAICLLEPVLATALPDKLLILHLVEMGIKTISGE